MAKTPVHASRLPWREVDGRAVVLHPANGKIHELNPTATLIWSKIDGTATLSELALALEESFEISGDEALSEVEVFVEELAANGLIRWTEA